MVVSTAAAVARPIPAQALHAIVVAGRPWARRQWVKESSQLLAAAYALWPGAPTRAAAEENEQNQSSGCPVVAVCKFQAPQALGDHSCSITSSVRLTRVASSATAAACSTPRNGSPVAVAAVT